MPLTSTDFAVMPSIRQINSTANKSLFSSSAPQNAQSPAHSSQLANGSIRGGTNGGVASISLLQSLPSNLADHMDMARPPHENPEYNFAHQSVNSTVSIVAPPGGQNGNFTFTQTPPNVALNPAPAHHQPRRAPMNYPPPPAQPPLPAAATAFSPITAAVPIAIPVTNLAIARSAVSLDEKYRNLFLKNFDLIDFGDFVFA